MFLTELLLQMTHFFIRKETFSWMYLDALNNWKWGEREEIKESNTAWLSTCKQGLCSMFYILCLCPQQFFKLDIIIHFLQMKSLKLRYEKLSQVTCPRSCSQLSGKLRLESWSACPGQTHLINLSNMFLMNEFNIMLRTRWLDNLKTLVEERF